MKTKTPEALELPDLADDVITRVESAIDDRYYMLLVGQRALVQVLVYAEESDPNVDLPEFKVDVWRPREKFGAMSEAEVNWPGCGSVPGRVAEAMAETLALAARVCIELNA